MDFGSMTGAPLATAVIVLIAVVLLGGMGLAFQGSIQF